MSAYTCAHHGHVKNFKEHLWWKLQLWVLAHVHIMVRLRASKSTSFLIMSNETSGDDNNTLKMFNQNPNMSPLFLIFVSKYGIVGECGKTFWSVKIISLDIFFYLFYCFFTGGFIAKLKGHYQCKRQKHFPPRIKVITWNIRIFWC